MFQHSLAEDLYSTLQKAVRGQVEAVARDTRHLEPPAGWLPPSPLSHARGEPSTAQCIALHYLLPCPYMVIITTSGAFYCTHNALHCIISFPPSCASGLNTVALLKGASAALGIGPKAALSNYIVIQCGARDWPQGN